VLPNSTLTIRDKQKGEVAKEDKKHLRAKKEEEGKGRV
jgi:hypothetical protein